MSRRIDLADALRRGTQQSHKDVEQAWRFREIFTESFSIDRYCALISRWQSFFESLEPCLIGFEIVDYRYRPRLPLLQADRSTLELNGHQAVEEPDGKTWTPSGYESAVGACYVIEGSCLGAKLICKRLRQKLGLEVSQSMRFYSLEFKRWPWFRQQLDHLGRQAGVNSVEVISGARECFRAIESQMS